jgi:hypothetical protein
VTVSKIAPQPYEYLAHRLKEVEAWPGSRALLCWTCPTMSPSAAIGASRCFSRRTTIASISVWGITVTVYEIAPRRYNHLANRLKEAQAWPGSRALLCRTRRTMSPSAVIDASPCFSKPTTTVSIGGWSPRQRAAPAQRSGPIA